MVSGCDGCSRRALLVGAATSLLACGGAAGVAATPGRDGRLRVPLSRAPVLRNDGGRAVIDAGDEPILVMREGPDALRALSLRCTHQGCIVDWNDEASELRCPCHGSRFGPTGEVREGPAKRSLPTYPATLEHDEVVVTMGPR